MTSRHFLSLIALAFVAAPAPADWAAGRSSSPSSREELKELEALVRRTTARVMPATVGLVIGSPSGAQSAGSGVIVSDDGLILTAAHVVGRPGEKLRVVLSDGTTVSGIALGVNTELDSGMARITSKVPEGAAWPGAEEGKWPKAELGKSADLHRGQWVISLGHHGGPKRERTPPLRLGRYEASFSNVLRSDCTLVGGDSGGPLFDLDGKVVGIHSKIGVFLDANMHVPVDLFTKQWDRLKAGDNINRKTPSLGLEIASDKREPTVIEVTPKKAAAKAGFKVGDVITSLDGEVIESKDDLRQQLLRYRAGQEVDVDVRRDGKTVTLTIKLGAAASE